MRTTTALVLLTIAAGCGKASTPPDSGTPDSGTHYPGYAAANRLPDSDPRAYGQYLFFYETWGLEQANTWPPVDFMVGLQTSEPGVFGDQFSKFGFIPDPNDDLPLGFKRGTVDPTKLHETCAPCHTSKLPDGRLWMGAPSPVLDFDGFRAEVDKRWVAAGHPSMLPAHATASKTVGPGRTDASAGSYCVPIPVKYPTYYQLGQRTRTNYLGAGLDVRTEVYLTLYTSGAGDPTARVQIPFPDKAKVGSFLEFFSTLQPPDAPAQAQAQIDQGKQVFHAAQCDACHHPDDVSQDGVITVPQDMSVPESVPGALASYPHGVIKTDTLHRVLIGEVSGNNPGGTCAGEDGGVTDGGNPGPPDGGSGIDPGYLALLEFIQNNQLRVSSTDGYRAGYLRGLWARAPYLHNGTVPTLADLLKPAAQRPVSFDVSGYTVDTTLPGNSNQGHEFGTSLSDADKTALIAYLNSL